MKQWQLSVIRWVSIFCAFVIADYGYHGNTTAWALFVVVMIANGVTNHMQGWNSRITFERRQHERNTE